MKTFGEQAAEYLCNIEIPAIPREFDVLTPFENQQVQELIHRFYTKYFNDSNSRTFLFGINPGRFGSGRTGIGFTDPIILNQLGFRNDLEQRSELSATYVYELIEYMGGIEWFYQHFYISAMSPVGYLKDGVNINYYDDKALQASLEDYMVRQIELQLEFGANRKKAISVGKGNNFAFLSKLNKKHGWFHEIDHIPHPRYVMQYRRKQKPEIIDQSAKVLLSSL